MLGPFGDGVAVRYQQNTGGTGYFSGVSVLALRGTRLTLLDRIGETGDRCNGGLVAAHLTEHEGAPALEYTIRLTPPIASGVRRMRPRAVERFAVEFGARCVAAGE